MIRDSVLIGLVNEQTEAFNRNAPIEEKVIILEKIQARKIELAELNNS